MMTLKRVRIAVSAACVALLTCGQMMAVAKQSSSATKKASEASVSAAPLEAAIRAQLTALAAAASAGDAERMAALWAIDGVYVDEDGIATHGRDSIHDRFATARARVPKVNLKLMPSTIKAVSPDVIWAEGTTVRETPAGPEATTRFTMLFQKRDGNWVISSATETALLSQPTSDHLSPLSWLIGDWTAQRGDAKVQMTADWAGKGKNFITCKFLSEEPGKPEKKDMQVIGWDPTIGKIVSWHFDSQGGFGYGTWEKKGNQWVVKTEGVEQTGTRTYATNLISLEGDGKFSWQSIARNVNGTPVPDTEVLAVQRVTR
ncbi:MAG TPA: nuclear transport factor 2 family protein [Candidatus Obscuribacterales bacterium]